MNMEVVAYSLVVAECVKALPADHLSSAFAHGTRHLAYFCHPRPRGWRGEFYEVDMCECDDILQELDSYDGNTRVSITAAEVLAGVIRYCIIAGKFYWASGWAVRDPADFMKPKPCAFAPVPTDDQKQYGVPGSPDTATLEEQAPANGAEMPEIETEAGCAQDYALDARVQAPLSLDTWGGGPAAGQSCGGVPLPAMQGCELEAPADAFAATWTCLSEYEPVNDKAKSLRGWHSTETPTWLHDLSEWWSLRRRSDAWPQAQEAEHNWLSAVVPAVADDRLTPNRHGPVGVAARLDLARKKAYRGALMGHQDWPSDLLDGLRVLERFTPGVTPQSELTEVAHEAYRLCRQRLATAIGCAPHDVGQARSAAGGLPLPVRQRFMADWIAHQQSDK